MATYSVALVYTDIARQKYALGAGNLNASSTSTTTAAYTQPSVGSSVTVSVDSVTNFAVGQSISVQSGGDTAGTYTVLTVPTTTSVELELDAVGSVAVAGTVALGATISLPLPLPLDFVASFKVGLGGWLTVGVPRTPDPTLTDLDIIVDQGRSSSEKRYPLITAPPYGTALAPLYYYEKAVSPMTVGAGPLANRLTVPCRLLAAEYNSDGVGNPVIYEIGLFDADGDMLVYGTFSGITKTVAYTLDFSSILVF